MSFSERLIITGTYNSILRDTAGWGPWQKCVIPNSKYIQWDKSIQSSACLNIPIWVYDYAFGIERVKISLLSPSLLDQLGELSEAEDALCEANILNNSDPEVWGYLSLVCLGTGRQQEAEQAYKYALKVGLEDPGLLDEIHQTQEEVGFGDPQFWDFIFLPESTGSDNITLITSSMLLSETLNTL